MTLNKQAVYIKAYVKHSKNIQNIQTFKLVRKLLNNQLFAQIKSTV